MKAKQFLGRLVNVVIEVIEVILGVHILLKLFGADRDTPFVQWVYELSDPLLRPFAGIFEDVVFRGQYVLDLSALFALIIYGIAGYLLLMLLGTSNRRKTRKR